MERGQVGIVLVQDASRISRNPLDSERFLEVVRRTGTLVFTNGRLFDPSNAELAELFGLRIEAILAWYENEHRVKRFKDARIAKAQNGHAVSRPPIGYVQSVKGKWIKDPNQAVQEAVARLFTLYHQVGSLNAVRKNLQHHGLLFPTRRRGEIHWKPIGRSQLEAILKNPHYSGDYVFQQQKAVPVNSRVTTRASPSGS
jgi:DNA invertase Pin-like site-specific DNA recombinase